MSNKTLFKEKNKYINVIFIGIIIALAFLHVSTGFDLTDEGYGFYNFECFPNFDKTWAVSTLYANLIGKIFTLLPYGHTILGMRIYCTILFCAFIVWEYFELSRYYSKIPVFIGILISMGLCWAPKGLLYHYLSYYLFNMAALLLVRAINTGKTKWYVVAGFLLGCNLFVRFPNITECCLIVALWAYGILKRKNVIKETFQCVSGYLLACVLGLAFIAVIWDFRAFYEMIISLFTMGKNVSEYNPRAYVLSMFYAFGLKKAFWLPFFILGGVSTIAYLILGNKKKLFRRIIILFDIIGFYALTVLMFKNNQFTVDYSNYSSIENWATLFIAFAIVFLIVCFFSKSIRLNDRLLAIISVLIIVVTPIGGNNFIFENYNNLFLVAPIFVSVLFNLIKAGYSKEGAQSTTIVFPFLVVMFLSSFALMIQSIGFGLEFVYRDGNFFKSEYRYVEGNNRLKGLRVTKEKAELIKDVSIAIKGWNLENKKAIIWGDNPGLFYVCSFDNAMSHAWIYLYSYLDSYLLNDLEVVAKCAEDEWPIFIYDKATGLEQFESSDIEWDYKGRILYSFMKENGYEKVYENEQVGIMVKER